MIPRDRRWRRKVRLQLGRLLAEPPQLGVRHRPEVGVESSLVRINGTNLGRPGDFEFGVALRDLVERDGGS